MARSVVGGRETELKFRVDAPAAFESLARAAGTTAQQAATQTNHFFDTTDRRLDSAKHTIRLRDEAGVFILSAKGPEHRSVDGKLAQKSEEEITVSSDEARSLLDSSTPPLTLLERRAEPTAAPLLSAIRALVADQPLTDIGSFRNERTRLPIRLSVNSEPVDFVFEMDRSSFPGGQIHYEVEVELKGVDPKAASDAVHSFFQQAQVAQAFVDGARGLDCLDSLHNASWDAERTMTFAGLCATIVSRCSAGIT